MAVTIHSQPGTHTPGYNEQYFVASSSNSNQSGFRYVVAVTVGSDTITERINKRPDNGQLYFDPSKIVQSYLNNNFSRTLTDFDAQAESIIYVTVGITEEYGSPVSGFAGASGSYYAWNAAYQAHDFSAYTYSTTTSAKDLTLAPSLTETININQKFLYKTWHRGFSTRDLYRLTIVAYDAPASIIATSVIQNSFYNVGAYANNLITLNCSPYGLNNYTGTFVSGTPGSVVPPTTTFYTLSFKDVASNTSSSTYTINVDSMCYKYDRYVLHFLNRLGNNDCFTFNLLNRKVSEKKTSDYKKNPFVNVSNNLVYYNDLADTVNYSTTITNKITLNSDWITDAQATWLKELFMSPSVILEDSTGALFSVKVTDTSYESKQKVNDRVFNITINLEYNYQDIRQRG